MKDKTDFLKHIVAKNNLEYKYKDLLRKLKIYVCKVLNKNASENSSENFLLEDLCKISTKYPDKRDTIINIINLIYGNELLTENSYEELKKLCNQIEQ